MSEQEPTPPYVTVHGVDGALLIERDQFGALCLWISRATGDGRFNVPLRFDKRGTTEVAKAIYGAAGLREQKPKK